MERSVALKKLSKLLGNNLGYRVNHKAPSPDDREAARAQIAPTREAHKELLRQREDRLKVILEADAEYQRLVLECRSAKTKLDELVSMATCYKFVVGVSRSIFFSVEAEGDSWEDVIAKVTAKQKRPPIAGAVAAPPAHL